MRKNNHRHKHKLFFFLLLQNMNSYDEAIEKICGKNGLGTIYIKKWFIDLYILLQKHSQFVNYTNYSPLYFN